MSKTRCLLIVDLQNGFTNDASAPLVERIEQEQRMHVLVAASRFYNAEGPFYRNLLDWHQLDRSSSGFQLAFKPRSDVFVFDKAVYSCLTREFCSWLKRNNVGEVQICGMDTDACVAKTALDLFDAGIRPIVLADLCASGFGHDVHTQALEMLRRLIGPDQVRHTGGEQV